MDIKESEVKKYCTIAKWQQFLQLDKVDLAKKGTHKPVKSMSTKSFARKVLNSMTIVSRKIAEGYM